MLFSNAERGKEGGRGGGGEGEEGGGIQVDACFDREVILVPWQKFLDPTPDTLWTKS